MWAALGWGALAASSLVIGVLLAFGRRWTPAPIGLILAFGAGALISAVSFELAEEGIAIGSPASVGGGLALGALTYFFADGLIADRHKNTPGGSGSGGSSGRSLALGSFLDGVPEQAVLGIGLAGGDPVSVALLAAIFVSNLPEGIGAGVDMQASGMTRGQVIKLFLAVAVVCTLSSGAGYAIADSISGDFQAAVNGFAAGALLVMLIDSMIPESRDKGGRPAGLLAVVGFAVATALSHV
jgi:zinc transporter, ZIP family